MVQLTKTKSAASVEHLFRVESGEGEDGRGLSEKVSIGNFQFFSYFENSCDNEHIILEPKASSL